MGTLYLAVERHLAGVFLVQPGPRRRLEAAAPHGQGASMRRCSCRRCRWRAGSSCGRSMTGRRRCDLTVSAVAVAMDGTTRPLAEATVTVGPDAAVLALTLPQVALRRGRDAGLRLAQRRAAGSAAMSSRRSRTRPMTCCRRGLTHQRCARRRTAGDRPSRPRRSPCSWRSRPISPGRFSHNAMTLFPGHPATDHLHPGGPRASAALSPFAIFIPRPTGR